MRPPQLAASRRRCRQVDRQYNWVPTARVDWKWTTTRYEKRNLPRFNGGLPRPSRRLLISARSLADLKPLAYDIQRPRKPHATYCAKYRVTFGGIMLSASGSGRNCTAGQGRDRLLAASISLRRKGTLPGRDNQFCRWKLRRI